MALVVGAGVGLSGCVDEQEPEDNDDQADAAAEFVADPTHIEFGLADTERQITIQNIGAPHTELTVENIKFSDDTDDAFISGDNWPEDRVELNGGESTQFSVQYAPFEPGEDSGAITLETSDPNHASAQIELTSQAPELTLSADPDQIDFGEVQIGAEQTQMVTLENTGQSPVTIEELTFDADADVFFAAGLNDESIPANEELPITLDEDQQLQIDVAYAPIEEQQDIGELVIETEFNEKIVALSGQGINEGCPTAVAELVDQQDAATTSVEVRSTIELSAQESTDPDGEDLSYEWSVIESPGQNTAYLEQATSQLATVTVDAVGHYTLELNVYNESDLSSCEPATVDIDAYTDSDIHIELNWSAVDLSPGDTGADLDLHYLNTDEGQWGDSRWDVHFANPNPDWDDGSEVTLTMDSLHGGRIESLYHNAPAVETRYSVGAYYFGDPEGVGSVAANTRIYIDGSLAMEQEQVLENSGAGDSNAGDFWHVADIEPSADAIEVDAIDELYDDQGFPTVD